MNDKASVAEVGADSIKGRGVVFRVRVVERARSDLAMFSAEIANLACLGAGGIARGCLAPLVGIKVSEGSRTISIGGNGLVMKVIH